MNKADLIDAMSNVTGFTKSDTAKGLDALVEVLQKNIRKKEGIKLVGFGSFSSKKRKARMGRNPQTGEEIQIPARNVPVFRPGKELKDAVK